MAFSRNFRNNTPPSSPCQPQRAEAPKKPFGGHDMATEKKPDASGGAVDKLGTGGTVDITPGDSAGGGVANTGGPSGEAAARGQELQPGGAILKGLAFLLNVPTEQRASGQKPGGPVPSPAPKPTKKSRKKRAITLAGGGPAAGLHIGTLIALEDAGIEFDVWALSCIGAWVGIVYNTRTGENRAQQTYDFFKQNVFRDDASYEWFPVNRAFAPEFATFGKAWTKFAFDRRDKFNTLIQPEEIYAAGVRSIEYFTDPSRWGKPSDFNYWLLNDVLAVNPVSRYMTSLLYLSRINGLSRIYYPDSRFLAQIPIEKLQKKSRGEIYHNAWRLRKGDGANRQDGELQIFHNRPDKYRKGDRKRPYLPISIKSLCACSALPYIEETINIDGEEYCEGALVDTVNFKDLLRDHPDLDEIWVSRIVDTTQVKPPNTLADGLANLAMLFAAEVGESDIKLFRQHLSSQIGPTPRVIEVEIKPGTQVGFEWNHKNLEAGVSEGKEAVRRLLKRDKSLKSAMKGP
jgi:predicted acylesterase/phospholipase RssA